MMRRVLSSILLTALLLVFGSAAGFAKDQKKATPTSTDPASSETCTTTGTILGNGLLSETECASSEDNGGAVEESAADPDVLDVDYVSSCQAYDVNTANGITCNVKIPGCDPDETKYDVRIKYAKGSDENPSGGWITDDWICVGPGGPPADLTVGPDDVLNALHRTGLPDAELQTQPGFKSGKTLVNFDTNFYTTVDPVDDTFTLLGQDVQVEATPTSYTWHFDSGQADQTRTTTTPGAPYPELDVTYAYDNAHVTVHPSVDVTYSARFSVNSGPWQTIPATVTIEGDPVSRYVAEATGILSEMN